MNRYYLLVAATLLLINPASLALTFVVNSSLDEPALNPGDGTALTAAGTVTLRSALQEANLQPGHDIIRTSGLPTQAQINIEGTLSIEDDVDILGPRLLFFFEILHERIFEVAASTYVRFTSLTVRGGSIEARVEADLGPFIYAAPNSVVEITRCTFQDGLAATNGGGIYLDHATAILESVSLYCRAEIDGGGIYNNGGTVIVNGRVSGPSHAGSNGGLIFNNEGRVDVSQVSLSNGMAGGFGGVLYSDGGVVELAPGRISYGTAAGGGGIYLTDGAELYASRTNFRQNEAVGAGASIYVNSGTVIAVQCSFAQSVAGGPGGGIYIESGYSASFVNCTFTDNGASLGGGLYVSPGATVTLGNTVIAGNNAQGEFTDFWGEFETLGHNLLGVAPTGVNAFMQGTVNEPLDAMLEYAQLYPGTGRLVFLYLPQPGSPLIDAADNALLSQPAFIGSRCVDAASVSRLRNQVIDIGATEFQGGTQQPPCGGHSADPNDTGRIDMSALLRVIQLYNARALHCDEATEDGYAPGAGDQTCSPHSSDYNPQDWRIDLNELLRVIQFFNMGGYTHCPDANTEDGFCPGVAE